MSTANSKDNASASSSPSNPSIVAIAKADTEEFLDGFLRVEAEVRALPKEKVTSVNLEVIGAVATALGALDKVRPLRKEMSELNGMDLTRLDRLRDFAFALARAHSVYRSALAPSERNSAIAEQLLAIRDQLFADAQALGKRNLLDLARAEKLRSGLGYKNLALDVNGLVMLFREAESRLAGKTAVTEEELERAARLALQLISRVGVKEQDPAVLSAAAHLREQAFTLFINAYDEVRRAVIYLRWHIGDADSIAPSLWAGRTSKRATDEPRATDGDDAADKAIIAATPASHAQR